MKLKNSCEMRLNMDLKPIGIKIRYEDWMRVQIANPPRGIWRRIVEKGIIAVLGPPCSEKEILSKIKELNSELNNQQKWLSQSRARKLEEELRLERNDGLDEYILGDGCFGCGSVLYLELIEKKAACKNCRNDPKLWRKFLKKLKLVEMKEVECVTK